MYSTLSCWLMTVNDHGDAGSL